MTLAVTISAGFAFFLSLIVLYRFTRPYRIKVEQTQICIVIGVCSWFIAELIYSYYQLWLNIEAPFPSIADIIYLAGYAFFAFYLFHTLKTFTQKVERELLILVSLAVAVSLGYIMNLSFGVAQLISVEDEILTMAVTVSYPILDGLLLVPAISLLWSIGKGDSSKIHWIMISLFVVLNAIGDIGFGYSAYIGTIGEETWIWDILFTAGYITLIAGLLWQNKYYSKKFSSNYIEWNLTENKND
jgi:hypothetical protein